MIFVSVGTHNESFNRLLEEIDKLIERGKINDKVVAQVGYSSYKPKNYRYFKFTSWQRILKLNKAAGVIITHGGAGNLILASHFNKPIIAVPRMKRYGEHINDHQLQLVKELEKQGRVIPVYDINELETAIGKAKKLKLGSVNNRKELKIVSIVRNYIENIARQKHKEV